MSRLAARRAVGAVLLLAVACAGGPLGRVQGPVGPKADGPLTVWVGPSPTLHPHAANPQVTAALFAPMVATDPVTRLPLWGPDVPRALVDDIASDDLRRWQLRIKDGWTWHDGSPVTAEDVARGWRAAVDAGLPVASTLFDIRVRDKSTLSFSLSAPYGQLPALLASPAFLPLPALHEQDPEAYALAPVGTGPFRITNRTAALLELEAFPAAPGGPPASPVIRVSLDPVPSPTTQLAVGPDGVAPPGSQTRTATLAVPGRQLAYLGLPLADARYADLDVRRALSLALDRQQLIDDAGPEGAVPADRLVGPGLARAPEVTCAACAHDPQAAREAWPGEPEGPLTIWFAAGAGNEDLVNAIAGQWRDALAVQNIQLASLPAGDLFDRLDDGEVSGPFRLTWAADLPSPSRVLQPLFGEAGTANDFDLDPTVADDPLDDADLTQDLGAATGAYGMAEQRVLDELPLIPLWFSVVTATSAEGITVELDGQGLLDWAAVS